MSTDQRRLSSVQAPSWLRLGFILGVLAMPFLGLDSALAEEDRDVDRPVEFRIESQPLGEALVQFAQQSGLELFSGDVGAELRLVEPLRGRYRPTVALERMLRGTGLRFELRRQVILIRAMAVVVEPDASASMDPSDSTSGETQASGTASRVRVDDEAARGAPQGDDATGPRRGSAAATGGSVSREAAADPGMLEEILVSALKRRQALLDVPASVSALRAEQIAARGTMSLADIALLVPGLSVVEQGIGRNRVQIRGIANRIGVPAVGYYVDELGVNSEIEGQLLDVRLLDLERIEILRGPQGTLYGQGSMGGTVKYVTADPDPTQRSGSVELDAGAVDAGDIGVRGALIANLPLIEQQLGLRLVAARQQLPGWVDNRTTATRDANEGEITTLRAKLLWQPPGPLRVTMLALHQDGAYEAESQSDARREIADAISTAGSDRYELLNLTVEARGERVDFLSSSGWLQRRQTQTQSIPSLVPAVNAAFGLRAQGYGLPSSWDIEVKSQELRWTSAATAPLAWTIGAFWRDSVQDLQGRDFTVPDPLPRSLQIQDGRFESESRALFGEAEYRLRPSVGVALGLRLFEETRGFRFDGGVPETGRARFRALTPRFGLALHASETIRLHASVSSGFRSGGFNNFVYLAPQVIPATYDVERLRTYELGGKARLRDGRLALDAAVYRNDWSNVIDLTAVSVDGQRRVIRTNAGAASGWGAEFAFEYSHSKQLSLSGQLNWNDMRYDTDTAAHRSGDRIDFVPSVTGALSLDRRFRAPFGWRAEGFLRLDYQHRTPIGWRRRDLGQNDVSDAARSMDARIGLRRERWEFSVYGRNLGDERGRLFANTDELVEPIRPQPRSVGVMLRANF